MIDITVPINLNLLGYHHVHMYTVTALKTFTHIPIDIIFEWIDDQ